MISYLQTEQTIPFWLGRVSVYVCVCVHMHICKFWNIISISKTLGNIVFSHVEISKIKDVWYVPLGPYKLKMKIQSKIGFKYCKITHFIKITLSDNSYI